MAGVKGMHSKLSTSPAYAEKVRARIKAGGIVFTLHQHILGKREMSPSQVTAALGLLNKVVPNLAHLEHSGEIEHNYVARVPEVSQSVETWGARYVPRTH